VTEQVNKLSVRKAEYLGGLAIEARATNEGEFSRSAFAAVVSESFDQRVGVPA
jgi:hypothetical protein